MCGRFTRLAERIVTKLRQIEVMQGQGKSIAAACKEAGICYGEGASWALLCASTIARLFASRLLFRFAKVRSS
jgi:hypothetical protein